MCYRRLLLSMVVCLFMFTKAFAELGQEGDWEMGPYVGYGFLDKYGSENPKNNLLYGARIGYFITEQASFESSYQILFTDTDRASALNSDVQIRSLRFNLLYNFLPDQRVRPLLTLGLGWEHAKIDNTLNSQDLGVNAGAGLRWFITDYLAARLDGRYIYTEVGEAIDDREHSFEGNVGVSFLFGGTPAIDSDSDGVKDKKDKCPNTPSGALVDPQGCPKDTDEDGVFDGVDQCPGTLKGWKVDAKGCPADSDGDTVPDSVDQCADTPKGMAVDSKGCSLDADGDGVGDNVDKCPGTPTGVGVDPTGCAIDDDGDSISNTEDKCPNTVRGVTVDASGCPVDSDTDGVTDDQDLCPNTAPQAQVDPKGCPLVSKARGVLKGVTFKFGSAELTKESLKILDEVAMALSEFPKVRVEVQGHTDNVGPAKTNLKISGDRAKAVVAYLVSKGVDRDRLEAKGYGGTKPIAKNNTKANRRKNRRVELVWLD